MATQRQDYSFAGDLSKINPAELPEGAIEKYRSTLEEQIKALEQRYDQPNWFRVAAGFAKPQLGGFLASLGSASEALGENVERQREQQLPIAQMKAQIEQANMLLGQKQKQNDLFQEWRASGKPMDENTYTRIASLGTDTEVAKAAKQFWDQARARVSTAIEVEQAGATLPRLDRSLMSFVDSALNPNADPKEVSARNQQYLAALDSAKPPQMDQAQWASMSRDDKRKTIDAYAAEQVRSGMTTEAGFQKQAMAAPDRLKLLGAMRDLAVGTDIPTIERTVDGKKQTVTGQQQMAEALGFFKGNNPFEVIARAAADGKILGGKLEGFDQYVRQYQMSPKVNDQFQKLVKLLAQDQVAMRSATTNPTDAFAALQTVGSPNIGNTQTALLSLIDLIGHSEQNVIEKYKYILDNRVPFRQLGVDPGYLQKQAKYAEEYKNIATRDPLIRTPSWYNPARSVTAEREAPAAAPAGGAPVAPAAPAASSGNAPSRPAAQSGATRSGERVIGGKTYIRQSDGSWKLKE